MAVTKSWESQVALTVEAMKPPVSPERRRELVWLVGSSLLIAFALMLVFGAKTHEFLEATTRLEQGTLLNLNADREPGNIAPFLQVLPDGPEREATARGIATYIERVRKLPNVGALSKVQVGNTTLRRTLAKLKPSFVVRTPSEYRRDFFLWAAAYFAAFYFVHFCWRVRRFAGDGSILPALHLLTGLGLALAVSIRDPLRDTMEFSRFAWGVAAGCAFLLLPLLRFFDYRKYSRWIYTPLLVAFGLFVALVAAGSGPTGSDSKVNLGPFQPVEAIKVLLVFFMAGYFANKWEWLRDLREKRLLPPGLRWLDLPRFRHALPVLCATGCSLLFFFMLKDLGPALVTGFLFLSLFAVARGRAGLAILGIALLVGGVYLGYRRGTPHTVVDRISMWTSPWDNDVRGGDQIAHSYWALSTGGPFGSGPGWGDPGMIPAGHTDLVMPAIGEEFGYCGVVVIALLFVFLFHRTMVIARSAADEYGFFLAIGLGTLIAIEMLLISAGVLGVIPLSGVVSPFLSAGNSAMLANFFLFAVILGISNRRRAESVTQPFVAPARWLALPLGVLTLVLVAKAGYVQVLHDGELIARDSRVIQEDGVKRPQHNPRLNSLARELTRGDILDRNGVVLATSRQDGREYPFGAATAHLLGDLRTGEKFHATNASLVEHDQNHKLQGFDDLHDLAPLVRYRHQPGNRAMQQLRAKDRTVKTSIDVRLQVKASEILAKRLLKAGQQRGALVMMNADTGDVLAMVSAPAPDGGNASPDELLDRARYGQYPPGSTFKLVTAIAALRLDPALSGKRFHCGPLGDGRVGARIPGWNRPIRDDIGDHAHGSPDMAHAITVSCNAYFAQLGVSAVGAKALLDTAHMLEIPAGDLPEVKKMLPFAAYGQGPVVITPFKMARVAATIAAGGSMPQGRWVLDESNDRQDGPKPILAQDRAEFIAKAMRAVVTEGTARRAMAGLDVQVAGKTGTAQIDEGEPHSWFAGFAPYDAPAGKRYAFAVVVEHGGYGAQMAGPIARELVEAARDLGIIARPAKPEVTNAHR
jgi:cell division protein FtsI/penicillin-binding protein 2/cell division protein FtsW (lipid II flippase)